MNFNYSYEKRNLNKNGKKLEREYKQVGMPDEDIQTMKKFDMEYFRLNRNTVLHTCDLQDSEDLENNGNDNFGNIDFKRIEYATIKEQEKIENHSRFWWIEELESEELIVAIKNLSQEDLEILDLSVFGGFSLKEISELKGIPYRTIKYRFAKIKKFLE